MAKGKSKEKEKPAKVSAKAPAKVTAREVAERTSSKGRAAVVRKEINTIRKDTERSFLLLAELLAEVNAKEYYLDYGFKTFAEYAEQELETKYRKAMYFVDIWNRTKELKISKPKLQKIGWTKAKEIVGVMTDDNAEELMEMAEGSSTKEVQEKVATDYKGEKDRKERVSFFKLSLKMNEAEADVITTAIEEAKKAASSENAVTALELICMEWQQQHDSTTPPSLESIIKYAETVFGVTLVMPAGAKAKAKAVVKEAKTKAAKKAKEAPEPEEGEEGEEGSDIDISGYSKSQLREFINENSLDVKIARGEDADSIRKKIVAALKSEPEPEPEQKSGKKGKGSAKGKKEAPKAKAAPAKGKKSSAGAEDEEDLNKILGIS